MVQQRGLACIGRTENSDLEAVPKSLGDPAALHFPLQAAAYVPQQAMHLGYDIHRHVLVHEVDRGFHQRRRSKELLTPYRRSFPQPTLQKPHRLPPLRFSLGSEKVAKAFHLREVQFLVPERPTRELPGLCRAGETGS